ncbi:hypothetical protein H5968_08720 [Sphaerospermopsis sp. LEGE 00249]|uniref:hypothetical protein n=1 Tax=Sphaerospermopsis sp. LEGE 00249 TaxID=1380707 RepID=UPI00164DA0BB|nr:hypothetical protein [Sphaerospermopsis sp. LEGE 00249]MBC5795230.1 hypothetical protein [Sphaerospermopsis sp. LEGE 00249]
MQLKTFLTSVAVTALVIPSVLANTSKVLAEDITILLENKTRANMTEFYASPSGVKNWENDILGDDVLRSGKAIEINFNDERTTCIYDFQAKFADGDVVEKYDINICKLAGGSYEFYD